jgi:UPF0755 protein
MSKRALIFISVLLVFVLFSFTALYVGYFLVSPAGMDKKEVIFMVKKGSGLRTISHELERKRLVKNKHLFTLCAFLKGGTKDIKAGEYSLNQTMSPVTIFHILSTGAIKTYTITIPEGLTARQISALLAKKNLTNMKDFLTLIMDPSLLAFYHIKATSLEGYLFPDTYIIDRDTDAWQLIELMVTRFQSIFFNLLKEKGSTQRLWSTHDIVTLASIVEKEGGRVEEKPIIASVFFNRLKKGMRLASDPTVIYGMKNFDGNLKKKDLRTPGPYNTYLNYGLPPGPIANPGEDSLKAVINPAETDYLYFVADKDGGHYFSPTLSEHNKAVQRYQKRRRNIPKKQ